MTDTREAILAQLALSVNVSGLTTVARNKLQLSDISRPAVIVLDGNEFTEEGYGRGKPSISPAIVSMTPEVWGFVGGSPEDVGAAVTALRAKLIKAVLTDATLRSLCHDGDIRYGGCSTGFSLGQKIEADLGLTFSFRYVLRPTEL